MSLDFQKSFREYSNIELLRVTLNPQDFQPKAIETAMLILRDRDINKAEIIQVENEILYREQIAFEKAEKIDQYKEKARDLFEPLANPTEKMEPMKWFRIFLLATGALYTWNFLVAVYNIVWWVSRYHTFGYELSTEIATLFLLPFLFYLIFRRRRWGWILMFFGSGFVVMSKIAHKIILLLFFKDMQPDIFEGFLTFAIHAAFLFFIWRPDISALFGVDQALKMKTLKNTLLIDAMFLIISFMMFKMV